MRVALDATPLALSSGGLRRYTEELSRALTSEFPEDVFTLLSEDSASGVWERRWWLNGANRAMSRLGTDLFHGTNFEVPYRRQRPAVVTIHDLSPWKNRQWHHNAARVRTRTPWLFRLGLVTMVITPTEAIRREVIPFFRMPADRVVAIHHGASATFSPPEEAPEPARPYFLYAGTLEPRKNLGMLLEAWRSLKTEADLVLVGRKRADAPPLLAEPGLRILGEIPDGELPLLYRQAAAFVYPSVYEGFGLPVLEAMQCGAAVITSSDPALAEIGANASLRADSPDSLAQLMRALLTDRELRASQREKCLRRAGDFSWRNCARQTRAVYAEAMARFV